MWNAFADTFVGDKPSTYLFGDPLSAPVYVYRYDWTTRMFRLLGLGAAHATEVPYVWGNLGNGPKDITVLSLRVMPTAPSAPVRMTSLTWP